MTEKGLNVSDIGALDKQIDTLLGCKPLSEAAVKELCEKVSHTSQLIKRQAPKEAHSDSRRRHLNSYLVLA